MKLGKYTPANKITIWSPRWHDRAILIAKHKVGTHNEVTFTKAPTYPDKYYLSGETIRRCPLDTNGKLPCFAVPISELEVLERV